MSCCDLSRDVVGEVSDLFSEHPKRLPTSSSGLTIAPPILGHVTFTRVPAATIDLEDQLGIRPCPIDELIAVSGSEQRRKRKLRPRHREDRPIQQSVGQAFQLASRRRNPRPALVEEVDEVADPRSAPPVDLAQDSGDLPQCGPTSRDRQMVDQPFRPNPGEARGDVHHGPLDGGRAHASHCAEVFIAKVCEAVNPHSDQVGTARRTQREDHLERDRVHVVEEQGRLVARERGSSAGEHRCMDERATWNRTWPDVEDRWVDSANDARAFSVDQSASRHPPHPQLGAQRRRRTDPPPIRRALRRPWSAWIDNNTTLPP